MEYIAHKADDGREQTVKEHLEGVAETARNFAVQSFKELCYAAGMAHDIGKYTAAFQNRILRGGKKTEHSIQGAQEYERLYGIRPWATLLEFCIAGHHSGLPDGGAKNSTEDSAELYGRLKRKSEDFSAYKNDVLLHECSDSDFLKLFDGIDKSRGEDKFREEFLERFAFFTRYVYSCLTDADFLDTESFCKPETKRGGTGNFNAALLKVEKRLIALSGGSVTRLQKSRAELLNQAVKNSECDSGIYLLNMPTGSGKTLCSIKLALQKAVSEGKDRIIYVIPYTSIIEQTARVFEDIFGEDVEILQHHSNFSFDNADTENDGTAEKLKKATENWDAKIIVTTSVQFFESMYHNKSSKLRKLHNMANSVIVFDEIHLIPLECLKPCLIGIEMLTKFVGSTAILLSATMPNYEELIKKYAFSSGVVNLITDKSCFENFRKCSFSYIGEQSNEALSGKANTFENSLIIVNKRKTARDLYSTLSGEKYHLSTYMCPAHRSEIISKINNALRENRHITVAATSLVEAGVDFDFGSVFRETAGLDSILQAGGRCNREGKRQNAEVFVFDSENKVQKGDIEIRANISADLFRSYPDISDSKCIDEYYRRLISHLDNIVADSGILKAYDGKPYTGKRLPFASFAKSFEYIKSETVGVVIPYDDNANTLIEKLRFGAEGVKRALQKYTVSLYNNELTELLKQGALESINGVFVLSNMSYYSYETGLKSEGEDFIV